jgi:hypothetical protein
LSYSTVCRGGPPGQGWAVEGALRRDIASGGYGNHIRGSGRDTGDFTIDAWLNESNGAISDRAFADRARTTAAALEAIARLPGRENLI